MVRGPGSDQKPSPTRQAREKARSAGLEQDRRPAPRALNKIEGPLRGPFRGPAPGAPGSGRSSRGYFFLLRSLGSLSLFRSREAFGLGRGDRDPVSLGLRGVGARHLHRQHASLVGGGDGGGIELVPEVPAPAEPRGRHPTVTALLTAAFHRQHRTVDLDRQILVCVETRSDDLEPVGAVVGVHPGFRHDRRERLGRHRLESPQQGGETPIEQVIEDRPRAQVEQPTCQHLHPSFLSLVLVSDSYLSRWHSYLNAAYLHAPITTVAQGGLFPVRSGGSHRLASGGMDLPRASQKVAAAAAEAGLRIDVTEFPEGTKTAADAAAAIGCEVAAIVKSLVFVVDEEPVVALVPGDRRLDTDRLAQTAGGNHVRRASLEEVRDATGFAAGGTPPFGHARALRVFADNALKRHDPVWAAAGTPTTVFPISLADLERISRPRWADLSEE